MSVVFGWYSFKLKSYNAEDLELDKEQWADSVFEIRQKVFHLFWLPLFSLGKVYSVRKNGDLFELPEILKVKLKEKKVKTPWYSYFIPISLVVGLIGFSIFIYIAESVMKIQNHSREKELFEISMNDVKNKLVNLETNSYLRLVNMNNYDKKSIKFLKLVDKNNLTYKFQLFKAVIPYYSEEIYYWKKLQQDTIILTQRQLNDIVCMDYDLFKERKCGLRILGDSQTYVVDQIEFFDEPVIDGDIDWDFWRPVRSRSFEYYNSRFTGYKNDRMWAFELTFQNFGVPVDLIQIQNITNNVQWIDSLPIRFNSYEYLKDYYIKANTLINPDTLKFKSKFIFQDSLKNKYEYIITGDKSMYEIIRK